MENNRLFTAICLVAALLLSACSQDDATDQGTTLTDGLYPLQIGAVTVTAEVSDGAQTRVAETADGSGSVFENGDEITVQLGGETTTYTYDGSSWTTDTQLYWTNTTQTLTAWYTSPSATTDGTVSLADQTDGIAYVLRSTARFAERVNLTFTHRLAKVRVLTKGTYDTSEAVIALTAPTTLEVSEGEITGTGDEGTITMLQTRYDGIGTCWEATVPGGTQITSVSIDGTACTLDGEGVTTVAGSLHTITLTAHQSGTTVVDLSELTGYYDIISPGGIYYFTGEYNGSFSSNIINISRSSDIYFDNVTINASNTAIAISTNPTVTIHVAGENEINGSIFMDNGSLTIKGSGPDDVLSVTSDNYIGIGGMDGDIVISNVTVRATGGNMPGIGFEWNYDGTITIEDATVYAYAGTDAPAIGSRLAGSISALMTVNISNSEIHAHRGTPENWNPDYIGWGEDGTGTINVGGGSITGSTVYCYTGSGDEVEHTYVYDDDGTPAEQD